MANIQKVDYETIPTYAKQIRSYGKELNTQMKEVYANITDLHNYWYGTRYNELVKSFNNMVSDINDMLTLVVQQVPYALETIANNYSQADKGANVTTASNEGPNKITSIAMSNDVGMKFITSSVSSIQVEVSNNFTNAKEKMDNIEASFNKIEWTSEAADTFKVQFKKLKTNIASSFENINDQFKKLMTQVEQDIESAESSNTVG